MTPLPSLRRKMKGHSTSQLIPLNQLVTSDLASRSILADFSKIKNEGNWQRYKRLGLFICLTYHHMLQQPSPTLKELVSQLSSLRDIPSLFE